MDSFKSLSNSKHFHVILFSFTYLIVEILYIKVTALAAKAEKEKLLKEKIEAGAEEGLLVIDVGKKGRGVAANQQFQKGDYVCTGSAKKSEP